MRNSMCTAACSCPYNSRVPEPSEGRAGTPASCRTMWVSRIRLNMANRPRVTRDKRVMSDEENALNLRLSDQQAVERILVQVG